jgi:hypothetical protein
MDTHTHISYVWNRNLHVLKNSSHVCCLKMLGATDSCCLNMEDLWGSHISSILHVDRKLSLVMVRQNNINITYISCKWWPSPVIKTHSLSWTKSFLWIWGIFMIVVKFFYKMHIFHMYHVVLTLAQTIGHAVRAAGSWIHVRYLSELWYVLYWW